MTPQPKQGEPLMPGQTESSTITCDGCGATDESKRCIGCLHDFGTPESAWVRKYNKPPEEAAPATEAVDLLEWCRTEIWSLCESIEDDPVLERALQGSDHERGYARGQMKAAKSIRNAMAEVFRIRISEVKEALASTTQPAQPDSVREALRGFINDLTDGQSNPSNCLSIDHDKLRARISQGLAALSTDPTS